MVQKGRLCSTSGPHHRPLTQCQGVPGPHHPLMRRLLQSQRLQLHSDMCRKAASTSSSQVLSQAIWTPCMNCTARLAGVRQAPKFWKASALLDLLTSMLKLCM